MFRRMALVGLLAVAALGATGGTVAAKSSAIIVRAQCTAASVSKLKLSHDDGRIETEFEVDQNRNDRAWRVTLTDNGTTVYRATRYTRAPSGSFEVRRLLANRVGTDRIVAKAINVRSGEICRVTASI
jgi:hypothetical protein